MKQKMTRFLNHENLENQLILLRKNHMISSNLPTKIREEPVFFNEGTWGTKVKGLFGSNCALEYDILNIIIEKIIIIKRNEK